MFYGHSYGEHKLYKTDYWKKDNGTIRKLFFPFANHYFRVLIKPNGEYLLFSNLLSDKSIKKLIQIDDWSQVKEDLSNSIKLNRPKGIIKKFKNGSHSETCFH